ncbi:MAG: HAMP domain-containing protein [Candidatus Omnitrophica bacterium]|nr:HAMP domain-containing protein [Candidatus Omnitrophota bacterium]
MNVSTNLRKNYFIRKKFQTKFILKFCALIVLASVIFSGILFLFLFSKGTVTTAFVNSRLTILTTADYVLPVLVASSVITVMLIGAATALVVMYTSHRIAGPLFRIERDVSMIGEGNLNLRINLRSTDEIGKMADAINEMTGNIQLRLLDIKKESKSISDQIDDLVLMAQRDDSVPGEVKNSIETLKEKKDELERSVNSFTLEDE